MKALETILQGYHQSTAPLFALALLLFATGVQAASDVWSGTVSGVWDGGALNWVVNGIPSSAYTAGDVVIFNDSGSAANTISSGATVSPASVTVNTSTKSYTISAVIGGAATLTKSGSSTLTLTGANTDTGATVVIGGTLSLTGSGSLSPSMASLSISNGAMLTSSVNNSFGQAQSGSWTIAGTIIGEATQTMPANVTLNNGTMSGPANPWWGTFLTWGATMITANGANNTINAGTLANYYDVLLNTPLSSDVLNVSSVIGGFEAEQGGLIKSGAGTLTMSGASIYTGTTAVNGGRLLVNSPGSLGSSGSAVTVASGATLGGSGTIGGSVTFATGALATSVVGSPLTINGALTLNNNTLYVSTSALGAGDYPLMTYGGALSGAFNSTPVISGLATNTTGTIVTGGGAVILHVVPNSLPTNSVPTTTTLALTSGTPTYGNSLTFTATVEVYDYTAIAATGDYVFEVDGTPVATNAISGGQATYITANLTVGTHTLTAEYSGDAIYLPSTNTLSQTINAALPIVSRIQAPQIINGPNNSSDMPTPAFWNGSQYAMYSANAYVYPMFGQDMRTMFELWAFYNDTNSVSLSPGTGFDNIGAWMMYVEVAHENTNLVRGFYHAEGWQTNGADVWDRKKIAYCESTDGGRTFQKVCAANTTLNYPNNLIITNWSGVAGLEDQDNTGDGHIIIVGNYYYCYFLQTANNIWSTHVARSALSDHGLPGTWYKYYDPAGDGGTNGTWTQPGLGGESTCPFGVNYIDGYGRQMTWNDGLNLFMIDDTYWPATPGTTGLYLAYSDNNMFGFTRAPYPLIATEGVYTNSYNINAWSRTNVPSKELQAYYTFAANDDSTYGGYPPLGSSCVDTSFWYVVTYLAPHEGFNKRYLLRQKVNLWHTTSSEPQDQVGRMELGLYRSWDGSDDWATTYNTLGHYYKLQTLGYLPTANIAGTVPIYCLFNTNTANHLLTTNLAEAYELNLLGYIFTVHLNGTIPLYRTTNSMASTYSASTNASDPGASLLGYLFPPVGDEIFAYRYDSSEQTDVTSGGAEGVPITHTGQQGYNNWYFYERLGTTNSGPLIPLKYSPATGQNAAYPNSVQVWASTNGGNHGATSAQGATLNAYGGTPGTNSSAVREWMAIDTGIAFVSARAFSRVAASGGTNVNVLVQKNGQLLWESTVTNGQSEAQSVSFRQWMAVNKGDTITFEIAPGSSIAYTNNTYFRTAVWFQWGPILLNGLGIKMSVNSNVVSLQWLGTVGQTYIVESSSTGIQGPWEAVSPPIPCSPSATNQLWSVTQTNSAAFYRLFLVQ